ncbi:MAG: AlpA family phage regulatory protein [Candidatus Binatus sp.]|jgi:prophage regulatory protein|uniref:helix-turn-helix transcriptional regulator n=1 Tax=Candidatus Binatus sp. TaxID=2811406 RepID=UPI003D0A1386
MSTSKSPDKNLDRFLREPEIRALTGLSRTTRWRLAREGKFPAAVQITDRVVGVRESALRTWLESRRVKADAAGAEQAAAR